MANRQAEIIMLEHLKASNEKMLLNVVQTIKEANELKDKIAQELINIDLRITEIMVGA
jgi:hypothetical protein